uniref:Uncharacterized protein n=1 Tax=Meloidogyne enterolobii TaxID=390850 RepID=A0A6V7WBI9_MELEN|nr:unnamed protein product [Meloidogyne enterolobii]
MVSLFFLVQFHSFYLWHIQMRTDKNTHTDRQNTSVFCSCPFVLVWCFVCPSSSVFCLSVFVRVLSVRLRPCFVCPSSSVFCLSVFVRVLSVRLRPCFVCPSSSVFCLSEFVRVLSVRLSSGVYFSVLSFDYATGKFIGV